jgi:hypothetical protein
VRRKRIEQISLSPDEPKTIDWSEIGPTDWGARIWLLNLIPGFTYSLRLFHKPVKFWVQYDVQNRQRRIISEKAARSAEHGVVCRYAINVIDRADQQIKVLEGCEKLFLEFRRCNQLTGVDLGGMNGIDLAITVVGAGLNLQYRVAYDSQRPTPFTETEKSMLMQQRFNLSTVFAVWRPKEAATAAEREKTL